VKTLKEHIRESTSPKELLDGLMKIVRDEKADGRDRIAAISTVLDIGWGRPGIGIDPDAPPARAPARKGGRRRKPNHGK
jgi:hypothetical protein